MLTDLIQNVALLVVLAVGLQRLTQRLNGHWWIWRVSAGTLFGLVGLVGMMTPVHFAPGVIYDGRSIVLALAGLFAGGIPAAIAVLICGTYRLYMGGAGAPVGVGVIIESAVLGVLLRHLRRHDEDWMRPGNLFIFAILVHLIMLVLQLFIPGGIGYEVVRRVGLPILTLYPMTFVLAAQLFLEGERRHAGILALSRSEARYRSLFEDNQAVMLLIEPEGARIVDANPAACDFYGWSREELRSKHLSEIDALLRQRSPPEARDFRGGKQHFFETHHRMADGSKRDVEVFSGTISFEGAAMIFTIVHDISEKKCVEDALRESESRIESIFRSVPVGIGVVVNRVIKEVNPQLCEITGYSAGELLEQSARMLYPDDKEFEVVGERKYAQIHERGTGTVETRWTRKDGTIINILLSSTSINLQDLSRGVTFTALDITERKRAEEERQRLQEQLNLAAKMESIGRLAGGVAHDFNNMLGVILGRAQLALDQVNRNDPVHTDLEEINKAAERSANLTRQLLGFARKQTISPKMLDFNERVESTLTMLNRLIGENINLLWRPGVDICPIRIDSGQVDQLLANLCLNARDAMESRAGTITIETENVTLDEEFCSRQPGCTPGDYVLLSVSDDGCGLDEETMTHIFEPFFTTKEIGRGTGLGLATVYGIVQQNNGLINVYSELGKGTIFRIYLPVQKQIAAESAPEPDPPSLSVGGKETILLVEDEELIRDLVQIMLDRLGYRVITTSSPDEAMKEAMKHRGKIHLLITDVIMPKMNGRDLARKLLESNPAMKTLFISGYTASVIAHQGVIEETVNFLSKPFGSRELAAKVRQVLDEGQGQG